MIKLFDTISGNLVGTITENQLQFLIDQLEEEYLEDQDYAFTSMTLDYFTSQGADTALLEVLRKALGTKEEVILRWSRE